MGPLPSAGPGVALSALQPPAICMCMSGSLPGAQQVVNPVNCISCLCVLLLHLPLRRPTDGAGCCPSAPCPQPQGPQALFRLLPRWVWHCCTCIVPTRVSGCHHSVATGATLKQCWSGVRYTVRLFIQAGKGNCVGGGGVGGGARE